jgi:hypothetical protein
MLSSHHFSDFLSALGKLKATRGLNEKKYEALPDDVDVALLDEELRRVHESRKGPKLLHVLVISLLVASIGTITYLSIQLNRTKAAHDAHSGIPKTGAELGDCGHTIEEARAAGCHFDPMSWLWVPHACYHPEMIEEFMNRTDWHFYSDVHLQPKDEVPLSEVYAGDHNLLFTEYKYHKIHCSYMWLKTQKVLTEHLPVDSNNLKQTHMKHCQKVLLNEFFHEDVNCTESPDIICPIQLTPDFTTCGYI